MSSYIGKININNTEYPIAQSLFGTCNTTANTATKVVTCADFDTLISGIVINVYFTYANTESSISLNVNSTGNKTVYVDSNSSILWDAGATKSFVYYNNQWRLINPTSVGTTYSTATTAIAGLMSADDKKKLNSVASSATYNLAFKTVKVGTTDLIADAVDDTLTITAGNNITLTPTASSDSFSIAATNTTYAVATTATAGLMSAADKIKVDKTISEAGLQDNSYASSSVADSTRIYMNIKGTDENLEENNVNLTIPMSGTGTTSGWFHAKAAVIQKKMNGEGYVLVGAFPLADTTNGFILDENVMDSTTIAAWEAIL